MAEPLKNYFNIEFVSKLAESVVTVYPQFDLARFQKAVINKDWEDRALKDRMRRISVCLGDFMPEYTKAVKLLMQVAHQFRDFTSMVFADFVEVHGLEHPDESLEALELFTKYSSSEFAIRPFIIRYEEKTMGRMLAWSKDENHQVRRLSSEGCRPRLPWAMALPKYKNDPSPILEILKNLKDDESAYVRKSVANNINDITKDNPALALKWSKSWYGKSQHTDWIIKHGLRTLLKNGNEEALKIFGFKEKVNAKVSTIRLSDGKINMGGDLKFSFDISNDDPESSFYKVGFVVGYMKSAGKTSEKIFHVSEKDFEPRDMVSFNKKLSFKDLSTRKHYPGKHYIYVVVNGNEFSRKGFELLP
jgi:3-methyladenine DNA glycosylase AlkC